MIKIDNIIKYLFEFFFLVCLIDPFSLLFNLKNPIWLILLTICCFRYKINIFFLIPIGTVFLCISISYILGYFQGNIDGVDKLIFYYRAMLPPLILLFWSRRFNYLILYLKPVVITSILVCILFLLTQSIPEFRYLLNGMSSDPEKSIVTIDSKIEYMGITFPMFYWGSLPSMTIVLGYYLYKVFSEYKFKYLIFTILVAIPFLISGSRVPILIPFACLYFVMSFSIKNCNNKFVRYSFYILPIIIGMFIIYISYMLASDLTQTSNAAKYGHVDSYLDLFASHPEYIFWGQGVGSKFYTVGFGRMTDITELTYFEILRVYGLFGIPLMCVIIYPIYKLWKHRKYGLVYSMIWSYIVFLVSAGTNPKLLNTAGMIVVVVMYSFLYNYKNLLKINCGTKM